MVTNAIDLLIISVFAFIPLLLGEKARNMSSGSLEDFILQGRRMKLLPMYATVFSTWMSAFAFMGGIGYFFEEGPIYMTTVGWDMLFAVLFLVLGRRIWHYGKTRGFMTGTDFFRGIYGSERLCVIVTTITLICTMLYLQAQIAGAVIVIQVSTGGRISPVMGGIIFFAILVIYLWEGGLRAVAMTDMFYGCLIVISMISTGLFLAHTAGGAGEVFRLVAEMDPQNVSISRQEEPQRLAMWVALFVIVPVGAFMGPQVWIRNYASGSAGNFTILPLLLGISSIICVGTLLSGSAGIVLAPDAEDPSALVIQLLQKEAHPFFQMFVTAGIFAAIFSTANSQVHALAAVFTLDVYRRRRGRRLPDRRLVMRTRWTILLICIVSYALMVLVQGGVFDLAVLGMAGMAQLIVPVVGALLWPRSSSEAAQAGILSGEAVFIGLLLLTGLDSSICGLIGLLFNGLVFVLISRIRVPDVSCAHRIAELRREYEGMDY
ncbi:MAG: sodium:solute symporter family protein [Firmicutes bacterium]|nr:sodium:solute symporter family protein [Bacillota bacterium]